MTQDRRTTKRRWFKMYPAECINGSIRYQLTPSQRGVWYDLLSFAALCSNTGDICDREGKAFPLSFIANRLNIGQVLLKGTIQLCIDDQRITEDEAGIHITNWTRYQSEYDRQKPYRQKKSLQELNQRYLDEHPEQVIGSTGDDNYEDTPLEDEPPLARGDESLEEHEEALMQQNPAVRAHKEKLERDYEDA